MARRVVGMAVVWMPMVVIPTGMVFDMAPIVILNWCQSM